MVAIGTTLRSMHKCRRLAHIAGDWGSPHDMVNGMAQSVTTDDYHYNPHRLLRKLLHGQLIPGGLLSWQQNP